MAKILHTSHNMKVCSPQKTVDPIQYIMLWTHIPEDDFEVDRLQSSVGYSYRKERQWNKCRALTETPCKQANMMNNSGTVSVYNMTPATTK